MPRHLSWRQPAGGDRTCNPRLRLTQIRWAGLILGVLALLSMVIYGFSASDEWTPLSCYNNALAYKGEALLHGLDRGAPTWSMPGYSIPNAWLCRLAGSALTPVLLSAAMVGSALLILGMGWLLVSPGCGVAAALLFSLTHPVWNIEGNQDRWLYVPTVLLSACALLWRARRPTPWRSAVFGFTVGLSLHVMSPLALFPLLLAGWEYLSAVRRGCPTRRESLARAAGLVLVPLAMLLPWTWMNWRMTGRFVPLEDGRLELHIATASLGIVPTVPRGSGHGLAGIASDQSLVWWAALEVVSHPLRFLSALLARCWHVVSLNPLNPVLGLFGLIGTIQGVRRGRSGAGALALLLGYWFVLHVTLSTERRYFLPFWPMLFVPAAGLLERWLPSPETGVRGHRPVTVMLALFLVPAAVWQIFLMTIVLAFPARAADPGGLERELARHPDNVWLLAERGTERLARGQPESAAADLSRAVARPEGSADERIRLKLASALVATGVPVADVEHLLTDSGYGLAAEQQLLRAIAALRRGERRSAKDELLRARAIHQAEVLDIPELHDAELRTRIVEADRDLLSLIRTTLMYWPPAERPVLIQALAEIITADAGFFLDLDFMVRTGALLIQDALREENPDAAFRIFTVIGGFRPGSLSPLESSVFESLGGTFERQGDRERAARVRAWLSRP